MNPPSQPAPNRPRPVREVFAGMGVPEEILAEQERMDNLLLAVMGKFGCDLDKSKWVDNSDWEDEEI